MNLLPKISVIICASAMSLTAVAAQNRNEMPDSEAVTGEFLVTFDQTVRVKDINKSKLFLNNSVYVKSTIPEMNIAVVVRPSFELQSTSLNTLRADSRIVRVTPNYIYRANLIPNDALFPKLWGMKNTGQTDSKQPGTEGIDIGVEKAWDITTGSRDVIVAVIDTGINYNHPDLAPNMWVNEAEKNGTSGVDDDANGYIDDIYGYNFVKNNGDPMDDNGHGSHCSGTIAGRGNDGQGVVGVNWESRLMAVKFLNEDGAGSLEDAVKGIAYATKMGAKVLSNSWGGGGFSQELKNVIDASAVGGAVFVAAAGNNSSNNDSVKTYPVGYDSANIIGVAAIDNRGSLANFSNYGKTSVHVAAPGVNILSVTTQGYEFWSGTSMATPHVSGIVALLLSQEPNLTNLQVKERLISTAVPLKSLKNKVLSRGLANAWTTLTNTTPPPDMNDPSLWATQPASISTKHPYTSDFKQEWEVSIPGAQEMALYFSKFDLEDKFDFIEVYDIAGNLVGKYTGGMNDSFTDEIKGNYAKIIFSTDNIINKYGFDLTKIAYR